MKEINTIIQEINNMDKDFISIAIDGYCGSGKTTFSKQLEEQLDGNLVHIDHFYLPFAQRKENWQDILAGNINYTRLENEVLSKLKDDNLTYGIFNPRKQEIVKTETICKKNIFILEGAYSHHPDIRKYFDYFIFIKCSDEKQKERLIAREKDNYQAFENVWIKRERDYFDGLDIISKADIIIDTTDKF